jgi:hypothetical protein
MPIYFDRPSLPGTQMDIAATLFALLSAGAALAAQSAVGEFAKSGGKAAFDALKARLTGAHNVESLDLLERARSKPGYAAEIKAELANPGIAADPEVASLAADLRAAIEALPKATLTAYAVDIETIRAGGALLFRNVEGVKAKSAESVGDMTFRGIKAPKS